MQEDFRKKFVLLSQVAKERKYAQEYLGLLARRGDLGSIRIGKRWYTTREWFWEFEKDIAAKKAEARISEAEIKPVEAVFVKRETIEEKVLTEKVKPRQEVKLQRFFVLPTIDLREVGNKGSLLEDKEVPGSQKMEKKVEIQEEARNLPALPRRQVGGRHGFSPSFAPEPVGELPFLPRFAFGASLVLLLALLFQVGWVYRDDLKKLARFESGVVAGAYSNRVDLSLVKNSSLDYLGNKGDKVKENVSFARVMLRAAMERSANSEQ